MTPQRLRLDRLETDAEDDGRLLAALPLRKPLEDIHLALREERIGLLLRNAVLDEDVPLRKNAPYRHDESVALSTLLTRRTHYPITHRCGKAAPALLVPSYPHHTHR
jgi:hypothetical protein